MHTNNSTKLRRSWTMHDINTILSLYARGCCTRYIVSLFKVTPNALYKALYRYYEKRRRQYYNNIKYHAIKSMYSIY